MEIDLTIYTRKDNCWRQDERKKGWPGVGMQRHIGLLEGKGNGGVTSQETP